MWKVRAKLLPLTFFLRRNDAEIWLSAFCHAQCWASPRSIYEDYRALIAPACNPTKGCKRTWGWQSCRCAIISPTLHSSAKNTSALTVPQIFVLSRYALSRDCKIGRYMHARMHACIVPASTFARVKRIDGFNLPDAIFAKLVTAKL